MKSRVFSVNKFVVSIVHLLLRFSIARGGRRHLIEFVPRLDWGFNRFSDDALDLLVVVVLFVGGLGGGGGAAAALFFFL